MKGVNRHSVAPRAVMRTERNYPLTHFSSIKTGTVHPIGFIPMLREDSIRGRLDFQIEMLETQELLINKVKARVSAYVVPWSAMPRFERSRDQFDRSWMGKPKTDDPGAAVVPFFTTHPWAAAGTHEIYDAAGMHGTVGAATNTMFRDAYNLVDNWRRRNVSRELVGRLMTDTSLARAYWHHAGFEHVVNDFDEARMRGEVAIDILDSKMAVKGIGLMNSAQTASEQAGVRQSETAAATLTGWRVKGSTAGGPSAGETTLFVKQGNNPNTASPDIWAELTGGSMSFPLSRLANVARMQAFAGIRERFSAHDDDIIDMLMAGLTLGEQWMMDPLFVTETVATCGQAKRYSSTAGQLDESAVSGVAKGSIYVRVPQLAVGGVVVLLCEILPDQLWERRKDPFLFATSVDDLPDAQIDSLDEIKVDVLTNGEVDVSHANPDDTFAYWPQNAKWDQPHIHMGGDMLRPAANTLVDDFRKRIYAIETVNPTFAEDFQIAGNVHNKPFLNDDLSARNFHILAEGNFILNGLTQFGPVLLEAVDDNYGKVAEKADQSQTVKE